MHSSLIRAYYKCLLSLVSNFTGTPGVSLASTRLQSNGERRRLSMRAISLDSFAPILRRERLLHTLMIN